MKGMLIGMVLAIGLVGCAAGTSDPIPEPPAVPSDNAPPAGLKSAQEEDSYSGEVTADLKRTFIVDELLGPPGGPERNSTAPTH
jgi:hypothetical protein